MDNRYYDKLFGGLNKKRTRKEALDLKDFIENRTTLTPIYWMTLTFKNAISVETAETKIAKYFHKVCCHHVRGHVQPIVVWNTIGGKVKNDNHAIMLYDKSKFDLRSKDKIKQIKRQWHYGNLPDIKVYDREEFAVLYATLKHKEQSFMMFCPNKGSCRDKNRRRNDCKYRKYPSLLLKG